VRSVTTLIITAVLSWIAPAQISDFLSASTIRVTTKLVQIDVFVHDKNDYAVTGLKKEDFQIFDNGKPQLIAVSVEETAESPHPRALPQNSLTTRLAAVNAARSGYAVIPLDWLNTEWSDQARSRDLVIRMLKTINPDVEVALCVLRSPTACGSRL